MPESSHKKVLIWGVNYSPEQTGIAPQNVWLAQQFLEQGYEVEVVTSFPYYPAWKIAKKDWGKTYRKELINRVTVHRCWMYVPRQPRLFKRMLQQFTFIMGSGLRILMLGKASIYVGVSPPFLISPVLRLIAAIKGRPYGIHVQDLEVSAAYQTSGMPGIVYNVFNGLGNWGLAKGAPEFRKRGGMLSSLKGKLPAKPIVPATILSNFAKSQASFRLEDMRALRAEYPAKKLLLYSGNLGDKQILDDLVLAVSKFPRDEVEWVIAGQGAQRKELETIIANLSAGNVHLVDLMPRRIYAMMLEAADFCVISERTRKKSWMPPGICFASKMLSYMKQGKPLLVYADTDSEISGIVDEYGCGLRLEKGESADDLIERMLKHDDLAAMHQASKSYYLQYREKYGFESWLNALESNS